MGSLRLQNIPTKAVSDGGRWSLHQDLDRDPGGDFVESVKRFGIIRPVLVQEGNDGYEVVCGIKRLRAAREILDQPAIDCLVINNGPEISDLLRLIIEDQKLSSPLSPIEKARCCLLCRQLLDAKSCHRLLSSALAGNQGNPDRLIPLLGLEQPIRSDIHRGAISEQTARELLSLKAPDRLVLHRLFRKLSPNHNKQRRIIEMSHIIAAQKEFSFVELFSTSYPEYIDDRPADNPPQMIHNLLQDLGRRSAPMSTEAEKRFSERIAALDLPPYCSVSHSKGFEQDNVTLNVHFSTFEAFDLKWQEIKRYFSDDKA